MIRTGVRRLFALALRRRDRWEREVEDEIKLHLALRAEQLAAQGRNPQDAYDEAVRLFGPLRASRARLLEAARHREVRMQRREWFADLGQDIRFGLRSLARQKAWTTVTVLTLALGIGATTAVFSAISSLLLHPINYPGADRVRLVFQQPSQGNSTGINVTIAASAPVLRAWQAGARSFDAAFAFSQFQMEMRTSGDPAELNGARIQPGFAEFAGARPIVGRSFVPSDVGDVAHPVLLGEGLWRARFGADRNVVGRAITLDDSLYTIIGVMPATLVTPRPDASTTDFWVPQSLADDRTGANLAVRLRPGVSDSAARAELDTIYQRVANARHDEASFQAIVATPASQLSFRGSLELLGFAVALVLLVACANVAHLLLARSSGRQRELAIRVALGAGSWRMFRQLLTESVLLATAGGSFGLLGGWLGLRAIVGSRPNGLRGIEHAHLDGTTVGLALAVTVLTSVVFGMLGVVQAGRDSAHDTLRTGSQPTSARGRLRNVLVVSEMALAATLVIGATMLIRSVINMQQADLGFEPKHLYTIRPSAARNHFASKAARGELMRTLATRLAATRGVEAVSVSGSPPGWWSFNVGRLEIEGRPAPPSNTTEFIRYNAIESDYFTTMKQRLAQGGMYTDTTSAGRQVIINEGFAKKTWRGESPIGKRIRIAQSGKEPWFTIVGVAANAATGGPVIGEQTAPLLYYPAADSNSQAMMVRTTGTADVLDPVKALAKSLDPGVTMRIQSVETSVAEAIAEPKFVMMLLTLFTALALMLAAIGLYGVMAYNVSQRTREIGIRVALGATRGRIGRAIVFNGLALAIAGAVAGSAVALWGTKVIESQLYGVARSDAVSFIAAGLVLVAAAIVACVVPTRRALAVDPMTAIRAD